MQLYLSCKVAKEIENSGKILVLGEGTKGHIKQQ